MNVDLYDPGNLNSVEYNINPTVNHGFVFGKS